MLKKRKVIAVIDDSLSVLSALSRLLSVFGYETELYASAEEFLDAVMTTEASCLILDIQLGESCGIQLAYYIKKSGLTIPIIFMTASDNESFKQRAMEIGCIDVLVKPFSADVLMRALVNVSPAQPGGESQRRN